MWSSGQLQVHCQPLCGAIIGVRIRSLSWTSVSTLHKINTFVDLTCHRCLFMWFVDIGHMGSILPKGPLTWICMGTLRLINFVKVNSRMGDLPRSIWFMVHPIIVTDRSMSKTKKVIGIRHTFSFTDVRYRLSPRWLSNPYPGVYIRVTRNFQRISYVGTYTKFALWWR
jgi:hypothetical protein